jgi:hypothetical protein
MSIGYGIGCNMIDANAAHPHKRAISAAYPGLQG